MVLLKKNWQNLTPSVMMGFVYAFTTISRLSITDSMSTSKMSLITSLTFGHIYHWTEVNYANTSWKQIIAPSAVAFWDMVR